MYVFKDLQSLVDGVKEQYERANAKVLNTRGKPRSYDHVFSCGERYGLKTALDFLNDYQNANPKGGR